MSEKLKTRDLPLLDFLKQLQIEYLVADLRSKIYKRDKDKTFWKDKVMPGKKKKIEDIVARNPDIITIFNSNKELLRIKETIYNQYGIPKFFYRDEEQRKELEIKDFLNYFSYGADFLIRTAENENKKATLEFLLLNGVAVKWSDYKNLEVKDLKFAQIKIRGEEKKITVHVSNLVRII